MTTAPLTTPSPPAPARKGTTAMLHYEALARTRIREAEQFAHHRVARQLRTSQRWRRLATWAQQKAERAERSL
jgi:hypothetical protein